MQYFGIVDLVAAGVFVMSWGFYAWLVDFSPWRNRTLTAAMNAQRRRWMETMLVRDNRMLDAAIMRILARSSQFFASTTMLVLGALIALTGYVQQALDVVSGLPFTVKGSARLLEVKIMLLVVIFTYAFFKFSWAMRQLGQASTLVGAAPRQPKDNPEQYAPVINRIARITSYAGSNHNYGLRAYYFGLAALAWFLHPWLMIVSTAWIMSVLYQREFASKTLQALVEEDTSTTLRT